MAQTKIVGIVNITADSFSDGGKYLEQCAAIEHAKELLTSGADIIELGAAPSNPRAAHVPTEVEIERLAPVIAALQGRCHLSIDTTKSDVLRFALAQKVSYINDIRGFPDESLYDELAASVAMLVVMHCMSDLDKAVRVAREPAEVWDSILRFFTARIARLEAAGIPCERMIADPGMGFFLAENPEPSLMVLARLEELKKHVGLAVMISVSRKSFLRNLATPEDCDIQSRTLAAELYAATQSVDFIRTHDVRVLHQSLLTVEAITDSGSRIVQ